MNFEPVEFVAFLKRMGLRHRSQAREGLYKDDVYAGPVVAVQIGDEMGERFVAVADAKKPKEWYDPALLRDLLVGPGNDYLSFNEQIAVVQDNWPAIVDAFGSWNSRRKTHRQLDRLRDTREERL